MSASGDAAKTTDELNNVIQLCDIVGCTVDQANNLLRKNNDSLEAAINEFYEESQIDSSAASGEFNDMEALLGESASLEAVKLCKITGCEVNLGKRLLVKNNGDLAAALNEFYDFREKNNISKTADSESDNVEDSSAAQQGAASLIKKYVNNTKLGNCHMERGSPHCFGCKQSNGQPHADPLSSSSRISMPVSTSAGRDANFCPNSVSGFYNQTMRLGGMESELNKIKDEMGFSAFEKEVDGFQIRRIKQKRSYNPNDVTETEFRVAEGHFLRMKANNSYFYGMEIASIDLVTNRVLEAKFEAKKNELSEAGKEAESLLLFHGTPQSNILSILKENFDPSKMRNGRAYGDGVYFSEQPEVSFGYSTDMRSLILCCVLLTPQCKEVDKREERFGRKGCWAIVVPEIDLILPKYVINFTRDSEMYSYGYL